MKAKFLIPTLMLAGAASWGNAALASDELAGAVIGAGAGAVIGHAIDRQDGAVVGGILGAVLGLAIADDNDGPGRRVVHAPPPRPVYGLAPVVVYEAPRARYVTQPVYVAPPRPLFGGVHARCDRRDERRDDRHDRRDDRRDGRWDGRWDGRHDYRGG